MKICMFEVGGGEILSGVSRGKLALQELLSHTFEPSQPQVLFIDFTRIEFASASFLRESVFAFRELIRGRKSKNYPVVSNVNDEIKDELRIVVDLDKGALMTCVIAEDDRVEDVQLIGELEPKQKITYDLVNKYKVADAGQLMRNYADEDIRITAWNNRLAGLSALGLIVEESQGRSKRYRTLFGGA